MLVAQLLCAAVGSAITADRPPSFLFILGDDIGWYGPTGPVETPEIPVSPGIASRATSELKIAPARLRELVDHSCRAAAGCEQGRFFVQQRDGQVSEHQSLDRG